MTEDERQLLKACCGIVGLLVDHARRGAGIQEYEWLENMLQGEIAPAFERVFGPRSTPETPADLVGALQDKVHTDAGPFRTGRAVKETAAESADACMAKVRQHFDERRCSCKDFPGADEFCTAHSTSRTGVDQ